MKSKIKYGSTRSLKSSYPQPSTTHIESATYTQYTCLMMSQQLLVLPFSKSFTPCLLACEPHTCTCNKVFVLCNTIKSNFYVTTLKRRCDMLLAPCIKYTRCSNKHKRFYRTAHISAHQNCIFPLSTSTLHLYTQHTYIVHHFRCLCYFTGKVCMCGSSLRRSLLLFMFRSA